MISGTALLTALTLLASPPPDAAALIARLARPVPSTTGYAEVRFMRMFRVPLVLHGELEYGGAKAAPSASLLWIVRRNYRPC
jgi:hypothetical protein